MDFVTTKELRAESGKVWAKLEAGEDIVITRNGKPFALMTPTQPNTMEQDLRSWHQARARSALEAMWKHAKEKGLDKMTLDEINAEIAAVRAERDEREKTSEVGH